MPETELNQDRLERAVDFYLLAKNTVLAQGFAYEIEWQDRLSFPEIDESHFLREAGWVVLSCGMRESVVRMKFPALSVAFCNWSSAGEIARHASKCKKRALRVFAHAGKVDSIVEIARLVESCGFVNFKDKIASGGTIFLQSLPFIGPITCYHLAKNLGLDVVKPDRHLLRISALAGCGTPAELCERISNVTGDRVSVVDIVMWRYATIDPSYQNFLRSYLH